MWAIGCILFLLVTGETPGIIRKFGTFKQVSEIFYLISIYIYVLIYIYIYIDIIGKATGELGTIEINPLI